MSSGALYRPAAGADGPDACPSHLRGLRLYIYIYIYIYKGSFGRTKSINCLGGATRLKLLV